MGLLMDDLQGPYSICPLPFHFRERLVKSRDWSRLWLHRFTGKTITGSAPFLCFIIACNLEVLSLSSNLLAAETRRSDGYS